MGNLHERLIQSTLIFNYIFFKINFTNIKKSPKNKIKIESK